MTGYQSKKAAALDEEGMYLVHQTAQLKAAGLPYTPTAKAYLKKVLDEDDDIQVYKRPWVGLTEEEIKECFKITPDLYLNLHIYARIEAKLKEKNT
jgi:hypothetical protein